MNRLVCGCVFLGSVLLQPVVHADGHDSAFSGKLNVGFSQMSGNVETESFNYGLQLKHAPASSPNSITFRADSTEAQQSGVTYQENMEVSILDIYRLNDRSSVYFKAAYKENIFRGIIDETDVGVGYLHSWVKDGKKSFSTRVGIQARDSNFTIKDAALEPSRTFALAGFRGSMPIMESIHLSSEFNYESNISNSEDYKMDLSVSLIFNVNANVNIVLSYKNMFDKLPVTGVQDTDEVLSTSLQYTF